MKNLILFLFLLVFQSYIHSQTNDSIVNSKQIKSNPIVYVENLLGYSNGGYKGLTGGGNINYQYKNNLFTLRLLELNNYKKEGTFIVIPVYTLIERVNEYALLFGKRLIEGNTSYSYSAGISILERKYLDDKSKTPLLYNRNQNIGFPFEFNIKWLCRVSALVCAV